MGIGLKTVCIVGGIDMFQQVTNESSSLVVVFVAAAKIASLLKRREGRTGLR